MTGQRVASLITQALIVLAWVATPVKGAENEIRPSQVIFIRAETVRGGIDSAFESRLRSRFLDHKVFYVTNKISEADLVFLAFTDYRMQTVAIKCEMWWQPCTKQRRYLAYVEGFVLAPEDYEKGFTSRDDLRGQAYWQGLVGSTSRISIPERRSRKLVKTFHEQTIHRVASK